MEKIKIILQSLKEEILPDFCLKTFSALQLKKKHVRGCGLAKTGENFFRVVGWLEEVFYGNTVHEYSIE